MRTKRWRKPGGRKAAQALNSCVRRASGSRDLLEHPYYDIVREIGPFPFRSLLRVIETCPEAFAHDGSRRWCAELRAGLRAYRLWLNGDVDDGFALYLFGNCAPSEYPAFDLGEIDIDRLAYVPPRLTVDGREFNDHAAELYAQNLRIESRDDDSRHSLRKRKKLHAGFVNRAVNRRLVIGHRPQRAVIGERAPRTVLKEQDVIKIRVLYLTEGISAGQLAKRFSVSAPTIAQIVKGDTWKHLPLDPTSCPEARRGV